ncbi:hypothetical protein KI688_012567 [Linnemannia hyalina]|uniref:Uncharacterized protein n=1 Tax=Linnemannia hyalina TaxID=64524 RepID=A0A9P7XVG7_9FUNG|nr:hypothetical protein KI688_012567 [Linnemannia hyalina]
MHHKRSTTLHPPEHLLSSLRTRGDDFLCGIPTVAGCAVDSRGVVTFVAVHYVYDTTKPYSAYITALRYDPAEVADPALSQGTGLDVYSLKNYDATLSSLAVLKNTSKPSSTFAPSTTFSTTLKKLDSMVAIGTANATTTTSTSPPLLLIQKSESYVKTNLQFSMILTPGATVAEIEGGANASISQRFGTDPSSTNTGSYPRPTGGTGGGSGSSGGGDGGSTGGCCGQVAGYDHYHHCRGSVDSRRRYPALFFGCIAACCLGFKESITGKKPEDRAGEAAVVGAQPDWTQSHKAEASVVTAGAGAYPVMTGYQSDGSATAISSPPQPQDNGSGYLFTGATSNAVPLTPPVTGSSPSLTIPQHSRPGV